MTTPGHDGVEGLDPGVAGTAAAAARRTILDRCEALVRDLRLESVRAWKERTGMPAIGYMPIYVPRELLHAQGALPVGVMGGGDAIEIIKGDACYQSYICHIPRSTIELGLNGSLDALDGMLFPAICDVIRNLSGMWQLQFPHKLSRYMDLPQNFDPETGGRFWKHELVSLASDLVTRGARPLDPEALRTSLRLYNGNRQAVARVDALRREAPWTAPASELCLLMRAGLVLPVEEFTTWLLDYETAARADTARRPMDHARVVLTGSFCEQPPMGLLRSLERSGCYIVDDDLVQVHRWIQGDIPVEGDPLDALVGAFLDQSCASPTRYIGDRIKGDDLVARVRRSGAEGVIFCAPSFCDPALLDQPMQVRAMERAGIPWTAFKYAENTGQFQVIREQAGTFADSIKLWSAA